MTILPLCNHVLPCYSAHGLHGTQNIWYAVLEFLEARNLLTAHHRMDTTC